MTKPAQPIEKAEALSPSDAVPTPDGESLSGIDGSGTTPHSAEPHDANASTQLGHHSRRLVDRPSGESETAYGKHERWNSARWAWEFLRRNPAFLKASREIQAGNADAKSRAEVAHRFGLAKFKSAFESFAKPYPPDFLVAAPPVVARFRESDRSDLGPLEVGELVARIDLNIALFDKHALQLQLKSIEKEAHDALSRFASASGKKQPVGKRVRTGGDVSKLDLLRVLDLLAMRESGGSHDDRIIMELLFPEKLKPKASGNTWRKFFERVKQRANEMAKHDYVKLVRAHNSKK